MKQDGQQLETLGEGGPEHEEGNPEQRKDEKGEIDFLVEKMKVLIQSEDDESHPKGHERKGDRRHLPY